MIKRSLSGESHRDRELCDQSSVDQSAHDTGEESDVPSELDSHKHGKRQQQASGEPTGPNQGATRKRKKISRGKKLSAEEVSEELTKKEGIKMDLPPEMPEWGLKLLEIIQSKFRHVNTSLSMVESDGKKNSKSVGKLEKQLVNLEEHTRVLKAENTQLKEHVIDLEYRQRRSNLIFEGIQDAQNETDLQCIQKLRYVLRGIPGLNTELFKID